MFMTIYTDFLHLLNNIRIRNKILISIGSSIIFFVLIISFFTFKRVESIVNLESGNAMMQILDQINSNIDYNIKKSEVSINSFYSGGEIKSLIAANPKLYEDRLAYLRAVKNQIFNFKNTNDNVTDLRIFSYNKDIPNDDTSVYSISEIENQPWLKGLFVNIDSDFFYWTNAGDGTWNKFSYIPTIYCYKAVFNDLNYRPLAVLRMDISLENIFDAINSVKFGKSGVVFVAKENGNLIYFNNKSRLNLGDFKAKIAEVVARKESEGSFTADIDGSREFLVFNKKNRLGWYVIGSIPQKELYEKADSIRNFIVLVSCLVCAIALIIAFCFSSLLTKRMTVLSHAIDNVGKGNFDVDVRVTGRDEVGQLAYNFNVMVGRIKELVGKVEEQYKRESVLLNEKYQLEILKMEAELCALQAQINPHFLYNTLEMIKGLVFSEDPQGNVINATQALSDMFKYNLDTGYIAKIIDEVKHIENYLMIQNLRFNNSVHLINNLDTDILNCSIVRFTFEPIIENAIIHGFKNKRADNNIRLFSEIMEEKLIIYISDDGVGIGDEKLTEIRKMLSSGEYNLGSGKKGGIGIFNVNGRIKRYFGPEYGIDITSSGGKGTTVSISLPREYEE